MKVDFYVSNERHLKTKALQLFLIQCDMVVTIIMVVGRSSHERVGLNTLVSVESTLNGLEYVSVVPDHVHYMFIVFPHKDEIFQSDVQVPYIERRRGLVVGA
ncbi:hypothetical protein TNCV_1574131 [Trichonephila clavipes]|nr:hypothetical protein TNCV_1574131 [Trichonephila clavipes]